MVQDFREDTGRGIWSPDGRRESLVLAGPRARRRWGHSWESRAVWAGGVLSAPPPSLLPTLPLRHLLKRNRN